MGGLSVLGIIHTLISLVAIFAAIAAFFQYGKITPHSTSGRVYLVTTALGCISAFGLSKAGGFNPGHALAIMTLGCLILGVFVERWQIKFWNYAQVLFFSFSLFLSMIPATNETLSRLPVGAPLANGPQDPLVQKAIGIIFVVFVVGLIYQMVRVRRTPTK